MRLFAFIYWTVVVLSQLTSASICSWESAQPPSMDDQLSHTYREGQKLMNRASKQLGTTFKGGTEDRRFRSCFGVGAAVAVIAWNKMMERDLLPQIGGFCHYLWALMFMKLYGESETEMCMLLGGIDPKTMRKYVWPYIYSIFELHYDVVSSTICLFTIFNWSLSMLTFLYQDIV